MTWIELRKKHSLTQEQMAKILSVSRVSIGSWESGETTPSINSLKKAADFFKLTGIEALELAGLEYAEKDASKLSHGEK